MKDEKVIENLKTIFGNLKTPPKEDKAKKWLEDKYRGIFKPNVKQ